MKKKLGKVTQEEKDLIQGLYERKNALVELFKSLSDGDMQRPEFHALYEKIVADMARTSGTYKRWWTDMRTKYGWDDVPGMRWSIDFDTCEVYLEGGHAEPG
jgi:CXXX repeat modification system protein